MTDGIPFYLAVSAPAIGVGLVLGVLVYLNVLPTVAALAALAVSAVIVGVLGGRYAADPEERIAESGGDTS